MNSKDVRDLHGFCKSQKRVGGSAPRGHKQMASMLCEKNTLQQHLQKKPSNDPKETLKRPATTTRVYLSLPELITYPSQSEAEEEACKAKLRQGLRHDLGPAHHFPNEWHVCASLSENPGFQRFNHFQDINQCENLGLAPWKRSPIPAK